MKVIIKWTLWQRRWSIGWWSLGVLGFIFINMIFYPSFKDQAADLQKSFENLSDTAVQFIGGSTDFFSPIGFLNSQIFFIMLPLLLGVLAIGLGGSLIAREEQEHTIESLLARPISRNRLLAGKALAGISILLVATIVALLTTLITAHFVELNVPVARIALATLECFMLCLTFGSIALAITAVGRARAASLGIASFIAIGGYVISSLATTVNWLHTPSKFLPFYYYRPEQALQGSISWSTIYFFVGVTAACGVISSLAFRKRDIY